MVLQGASEKKTAPLFYTAAGFLNLHRSDPTQINYWATGTIEVSAFMISHSTEFVRLAVTYQILLTYTF